MILTEDLNKISPQEAKDKNLFGPVYHGSTSDKLDQINTQGFKISIGHERSGDVSHGYEMMDYWGGIPAPIHHLGFGVYFTTSKAIATRFSYGNPNIGPYFLDVPNLEIINWGSHGTMMKWWIENGYNYDKQKFLIWNNDEVKFGSKIPEMKQERLRATLNLTNTLKSKYDGVWYKGKGLYKLLDSDQVVIFDPSRIYKLDKNLAKPGEIGSKVISKVGIKNPRNQDIPIGTRGIIVDKKKPNEHQKWAEGSEWIYSIKFEKGGEQWGVLDSWIEPYEGKRKLKGGISESTIKPMTKGDCYANARKWAWDNDDGNTFIVHGKATNVEKKTFDHAWVEQGNDVIDPTQGVKMEKDKWYSLLQAEPEAKYSPHQATIIMMRSRKMGPWFPDEVENFYMWRKDLGDNKNPKSVKEGVESHINRRNFWKVYEAVYKKKDPYYHISKIEEEWMVNFIKKHFKDEKLSSTLRKASQKRRHMPHRRSDVIQYNAELTDNVKMIFLIQKCAIDGLYFSYQSIVGNQPSSWKMFIPSKSKHLVAESQILDESFDPHISKVEEEWIVNFIKRHFSDDLVSSTLHKTGIHRKRSPNENEDMIRYDAKLHEDWLINFLIKKDASNGVYFRFRNVVDKFVGPWNDVFPSENPPKLKESYDEDNIPYNSITKLEEENAIKFIIQKLKKINFQFDVNKLKKIKHERKKLFNIHDTDVKYYTDQITYSDGNVSIIMEKGGGGRFFYRIVYGESESCWNSVEYDLQENKTEEYTPITKEEEAFAKQTLVRKLRKFFGNYVETLKKEKHERKIKGETQGSKLFFTDRITYSFQTGWGELVYVFIEKSSNKLFYSYETSSINSGWVAINESINETEEYTPITKENTEESDYTPITKEDEILGKQYIIKRLKNTHGNIDTIKKIKHERKVKSWNSNEITDIITYSFGIHNNLIYLEKIDGRLVFRYETPEFRSAFEPIVVNEEVSKKNYIPITKQEEEYFKFILPRKLVEPTNKKDAINSLKKIRRYQIEWKVVQEYDDADVIDFSVQLVMDGTYCFIFSLIKTGDGKLYYTFRKNIDDNIFKNRIQPLTEGESHYTALKQTGYWGRQGAGAIILAQDTGRILLPYRGRSVEQPHTWGVWGGAIDEGEDPSQAVMRELSEEVGYKLEIKELIPLYVFEDPKVGFRYSNFLAVIPHEFAPNLDRQTNPHAWETEKAEWVEYGQWPRPVHFGLNALLSNSGQQILNVINKYSSAKTQPPKQPKMDVIKYKAALDIIQRTWNSMYRSDSIQSTVDRFDYSQLSMFALNEEPIQRIIEQYGQQFYPENPEPGYKFLEDVEAVLEILENRYYSRISKKIDPRDPLFLLKKLVQGKSWEKAKLDIHKFSLSGPIVPDKAHIEDEDAELAFRRLFLNAMGETFYDASKFTNLVRLSDIEKSPDDKKEDEYLINLFLRSYTPSGSTRFPSRVKVYRGTNSPHSKIRPGDFTSFDRDYARWYIRGKYGAVAADILPSKDLLVYKMEPHQSELIYWPEGHQIQKYTGHVPTFKEFWNQYK